LYIINEDNNKIEKISNIFNLVLTGLILLSNIYAISLAYIFGENSYIYKISHRIKIIKENIPKIKEKEKVNFQNNESDRTYTEDRIKNDNIINNDIHKPIEKNDKNNILNSEKKRLFHFCIVCLLIRSNITFFPCGHKYLCKNCYEEKKDKIKNCSICRKAIEKIKEKL
jgi:hypothetical protein